MSDSPGLVDFAIGLVNFLGGGDSIYIECLLSTGFAKIILKGLKVTKFDIQYLTQTPLCDFRQVTKHNSTTQE